LLEADEKLSFWNRLMIMRLVRFSTLGSSKKIREILLKKLLKFEKKSELENFNLELSEKIFSKFYDNSAEIA